MKKNKIILYVCLSLMLLVGASCNSSQLAVEGGDTLYINIGVL